MTEEASVPILILCTPENDVTEVIRKRLDQKGIPFCILPVGSHFAPPHLPDTCGAVLILLCRELVQAAPLDILCQLQQRGATLLPLGREDARSLWASLTAGREDDFSGQEVFQLEDPWETRLPFPLEEDSTLPPPFPHTQVNRKTPLLRHPLVDLNVPEEPPPPPIRFRTAENAASAPSHAPSRSLIRWLIFFLCLSLAALLLALGKLLCSTTTGSSTPPAPASADASSGEVGRPSSPPAEMPSKAENSSTPAPAGETSNEGCPHASSEEQTREQQKEENAASPPSPREYQYTSSLFFSKEEEPSWVIFHQEEAGNDNRSAEDSTPVSPAVSRPEKPKPNPTTASRREGRRGATSQAASSKQQAEPNKEKETSESMNSSSGKASPLSEHRCPPRRLIEKRRPNALNQAGEGARIGCETCKKYLRAYQKAFQNKQEEASSPRS